MGDRRAGWGQARVSRASPRPTLTWTQQQNLGTRSVRCGCSRRPLTPPRNTHAQSHHVRATCPASRVRARCGGVPTVGFAPTAPTQTPPLRKIPAEVAKAWAQWLPFYG